MYLLWNSDYHLRPSWHSLCHPYSHLLNTVQVFKNLGGVLEVIPRACLHVDTSLVRGTKLWDLLIDTISIFFLQKLIVFFIQKSFARVKKYHTAFETWLQHKPALFTEGWPSVVSCVASVARLRCGICDGPLTTLIILSFYFLMNWSSILKHFLVTHKCEGPL